jgi:hypothetical protein
MKNNTTTLIVIAIIIAGASFFGGMKYQESKRPAFNRQTTNNDMRRGQNGNNRPVNGEILNSDDKSITVKLIDGSSKIVLLTSTTSLNKAAEATKSDLKPGERISVFGVTNADGSVTAQNIQLNPIMRGIGASPSGTPAK